MPPLHCPIISIALIPFLCLVDYPQTERAGPAAREPPRGDRGGTSRAPGPPGGALPGPAVGAEGGARTGRSAGEAGAHRERRRGGGAPAGRGGRPAPAHRAGVALHTGDRAGQGQARWERTGGQGRGTARASVSPTPQGAAPCGWQSVDTDGSPTPAWPGPCPPCSGCRGTWLWFEVCSTLAVPADAGLAGRLPTGPSAHRIPARRQPHSP